MNIEDERHRRRAGRRPSSLALNSMLGALGDIALLAAGLATAAMTARWLGPAGKGALSALLLIGHGFLFYGLTFGLGDAAMFMVRGQRESVQRSVSASLPLLTAASAIGIGFLFGVAALADWSGILPAVCATALGLVAWIHLEFLTGVLNSEERFPLTSGTRAAVSLATTIGTYLLVGVWDGQVFGATVAVLISVGGGVIFLAAVLHSEGISLRPRWDPGYLRPALRFGIPNQASFLFLLIAQRFDQLIVYALRGEAHGGRYSVSLTLGWLITYLPAALTKAAFPRMASLDPDDALSLLAQMLRISLITALSAGIALALTIPMAIPVFFGSSYRSSTAPALLLLVAGLLWSVQWTLTRSAAARGRPGLLIVTLVFDFAVTLSLDLLLIPAWGLEGAALASAAGSFVGLMTAISLGAAKGLSLSKVVPRSDDLRVILTSFKRGFRSDV